MEEKVNNCVRELRYEKNITQEELANAVNVTRQTIIAIEKGNYAPSVALALNISDFFDKSVNEVFTLNKG